MIKEAFRLIVVVPVLLCGFALSAAGAEPAQPFAAWLQELRSEALAAGISKQTLDAALATVREPLDLVVRADRSQPERLQTVADYVAARVTPERVARGRRMLARYPTWLGRVERRYGVQRRYLVALWGIESGYGSHTGDVPVIRALATLAHEGRRGAYFRRELLDALRILDTGQVPLERLRGSWAGAMGQCQFMPSAFRRFAVDGDGDGRIDLWNSIPDVLASSANYLAKNGWRDDRIWGRPVRLPAGFDPALAGLENLRPLARWQRLGIRRSDGRALPRRDIEAALLLPDGPGGPAYLVYSNFQTLLAWNRAEAFAVAVGTLAERLGANP
jgi:membrane-bound lytic murein transglycosylase B